MTLNLRESDLFSMSRKQLFERICAGHSVKAEELGDVQYRGVSLGLPQVVERLTWKKFMKVFVADDQQGWGFNVRLQQTALDEPCEPLTDKKGKPLRFGRYGLRPAQKGEFEDFESPPLVLDYGACEGRSFDPMRCLRVSTA